MRYLPRRAFYVSGGGKLKRNYPWWFCLLPLPLVWWAAVAVASHWQTGGLNSVLAALNAALAAPFALRWTEHSARFLLLFTLTYAVAAVVLVSDKCNTRPGAEHGSACWGDVSALNRKYRDKHGTNLLLTKHFQIGVDGYKHKHNTNVLVIGGSGAGKTRTYAVPNVLQAGCSMVITDPKAEILRKTGAFLLAQGYEVRVFDLIDPSASFCYNPFCYVQSDKDVLQLIADLIQNTTPPNAHENDPFWSKAETALLQALMLYLIHEAPADEQNFAMVMEMIAAAEVREDDADYQSPLDILFERLEMREPDSIACKQYRIFKQAAGKTARSILVSVGVRLAAFNLPQIARLTMADELHLEELGERKIALFCCIPDSDKSLNYLVGIRFALAKAAVTYGLELMQAVFSIVQGTVSTVITQSGTSGMNSTTLPQELVDAINNVGFWDSIPLWAVTLIGGLLITVLSFVMILTVYGRMFSLWMYAAIAPIPLATFAGEPTANVGKNFIRSYAGVCLQGLVIALSCVIFSALAASPPSVDTSASVVTAVWTYVAELTFNLLVLVGAIKGCDRIVKEIMGL